MRCVCSRMMPSMRGTACTAAHLVAHGSGYDAPEASRGRDAGLVQQEVRHRIVEPASEVAENCAVCAYFVYHVELRVGLCVPSSFTTRLGGFREKSSSMLMNLPLQAA